MSKSAGHDGQGSDFRGSVSGIPAKNIKNLLEPGIAMGASTVLFWIVNEQRQFLLASEIGVGALGGTEQIFVPLRLNSLGQVLETKRSRSFEQDFQSMRLICHQVLVTNDTTVFGIVELVWIGGQIDRDLNTQAADQFANQLALELSNPVPSLSEKFWVDLDSFLLQLYQSPGSKETASIAVNDGRLLLGVDRMVIAVPRGSKAKLLALSGQSDIQHHSPEVIGLERLAQHVLTSGEEIRYTGNIVGLPTWIADPLSNYISESRTRMLWVIPLNYTKRIPTTDPLETQPREEILLVGCLVLEQLRDSRLSNETRSRAEIVADHLAVALHNSQRRESIFLLPLWESIGRTIQSLNARRRNWAIAIVTCVIGLGVLLIYLPWEYKVTCQGKLMPVERADLFAPWNAEVTDVLVEDGQSVDTNQLLLTLRSDELNIESITVNTMLAEKRKLLRALESQIDRVEQSGDATDSIRLQGEAKRTEIEIGGAEEKLKMVRQRIENLQIKSPIKGAVATFQLQQLLLARPVQRGDRLMQVMNTSGKWRLELDVPEHHCGHVLSAFRQSGAKEMKVEFVLATAVEYSYEAKLTSLATRTEESESDGSVIEAIALLLNESEIPGTHVGAEVIAKVHCGQRSLGYCLFGDAIEFVRRHVWF